MKRSSSKFTRSHLPMYAQLAALLRQRISAGEWDLNERLPTVENLIAQYQVARSTVRQAIGILEHEGLIWRKQGKGTYLTQGFESQPCLPLATQWGRLMHMIEGTTMRTFSTGRVEKPLLPSDVSNEFDKWQRIQRVHSKDNIPYCVIDLYIADRIYDLDPLRFESELAMRVISELDSVEVGSAHQTLTISAANTQLAELLDIEFASPVAEVKRVVEDALGRVFYYSEITYRGDFVRFDIDLLGNRGSDV
ncbi:GntR family transcriptional regulator [Halomonas sp. KAO]|uniref:GntR family transcriptional regulator n=1 Tax=Halomonas sp. KAO TaxID=2783858 RepID=UPI001E2F0FBA|nr:GntR family transcriptional regulator [Halomonas sp. KAO]